MSALFGRRPKPEAPARMPDPEDPQVRQAEERRRREIAARSGRASTIMSRRQRSDSGVGTEAYKNSLLGQG